MNVARLFVAVAGVVIARLEGSSLVQEWRAFSVEDFYSRCPFGWALLCSLDITKGCSQTIGNSRDSKESGINFNRIRIGDFRIQTANDRSLKQASAAP